MDRVTQTLVRAACATVVGFILGQSVMAGLQASRARADDPPVSRSDVERIVRALDAQTRAQLEVAEQVKRAGERCR
jgi:hypothetical protein